MGPNWKFLLRLTSGNLYIPELVSGPSIKDFGNSILNPYRLDFGDVDSRYSAESHRVLGFLQSLSILTLWTELNGMSEF